MNQENHKGAKTRRHKEDEKLVAYEPAPATIEALAKEVIGAGIEVHQAIGPGFPESVYENALSLELSARNISHACQHPISVVYRGQTVGEGRADLLVADGLVVELKAVETINDAHRAQVVAYLKALNLKLGLLMNFHAAVLRDGIRRIIN